MILEYSPNFQKLYLYEINNESSFKIKGFDTKEVIESTTVYIFERKLKMEENVGDDLSSNLKKLKCKCDKLIRYQSINLLPSHNWNEYIDLWSCHESEFKSTLNFEPRARTNGILLGAYFFMADKGLFNCNCYNERIFYNEINFGVEIDDIIYFAFCNYFESNTFCFIDDKIKMVLFDKCYISDINKEMNLFDKCHPGDINEEIMCPSLKIGFKHVKSQETESELLNSFFRKRICEIILKNKINIKILDFEVSYIPKSTFAKINF